MRYIKGIIYVSAFIAQISLFAQSIALQDSNQYWTITDSQRINWNVANESRLPHSGNIEMSGKRISALIYFSIDEDKMLTLRKDVIFPQLRTFNKTNQPDWKKYRAYFRREGNTNHDPLINIGDRTIIPGPVNHVEIDGTLIFHHEAVEGVQITRSIFPSMNDRYLCEQWKIKNTTSEILNINIATPTSIQSEYGYKGKYNYLTYTTESGTVNIPPGQTHEMAIYYAATVTQPTDNSIDETSENFHWKKAQEERDNYLRYLQNNLILTTPDPVLNTMFGFSKIRSAESIFESNMGLIHSPGGGNYYLGTWANDQVEYSGPFFPYLGYNDANTAAYNSYQKFLENIPKEGHIPYAFEMDGIFPMKHLDRGDAAMIVYGTAQYVLSTGNKEIGKKLWPLIEWSIEYCHKMKNEEGAIQSTSDEMEGRITTGKANLSTSTLYYGGLKFAIPLARSLGKEKLAVEYEKRSIEMNDVIENYFGATIEGLNTYKYFSENKYLRHWICLPLNMGISTRKEATLKALFDKLWTDNGILVEYNKDSNTQKVFWDRGTLYAFRGALKAGAAELAIDRLKSYSNKRLLGDHVPYAVEAYPENNMKHLSAESALYARIFTEGMFGIEPIGFDKIKIKPSLPSHWNEMSITNMHLMGKKTDIYVNRREKLLKITLLQNNKVIFESMISEGEEIEVKI